MGGIVNKGRNLKKTIQNSVKKNHIPPPLLNKNESCYMNAIIQALGSCNHMREDLIIFETICKSNQLKLFIQLLKALNSHAAQEEFDNFIDMYGWCKQGQQDSYEVMSYIINSIYSDIKKVLTKRDDGATKNGLPGIITMSSKTSCSCISQNQNILQDLALHLPLVNNGGTQYDIKEMINAIFEKGHVDDICDRCKKQQTLSISIEGKLPRTICFHIQANKLDTASRTIIKPDYSLDYPYFLEFNGMMYELVSFLEHLGGVSVGHYVAFRKFEGHWYTVNDTIISRLDEVDSPMLHCMKPYVLFYELFL